jgi:uncharacterized protein YcbK (DUF882 family)
MRRFAVVASMLALAGPAAAQGTQAAETADYQSKKDRERAQKSTKHGAPPAPGTKPGKLINLYNQWTHDWLAVDPGQLPSLAQVNRFLRDHFTNEATTMDAKLIGAVIGAARDFKSDVVNVVSGFRHPKYNLMLRKKGRQVARDSQHTHGTAVDFRIPRVPVKKLEQWAKAQKLGGVGVYTSSGFIHMDTGPIRSWSAE